MKKKSKSSEKPKKPKKPVFFQGRDQIRAPEVIWAEYKSKLSLMGLTPGTRLRGKKPPQYIVTCTLLLWFSRLSKEKAEEWLEEQFKVLDSLIPPDWRVTQEEEEPDDDGAAASKSEAAKQSRKGKGGRTKSK